MPTRSTFTLPPPKYWQEFEDMLHDLFRAEWKDPNAQKNGRLGQPQNGVDVYGQPEQKEAWEGVQAKKKDQLADSSVTEEELEAEVTNAKSFTPKLSNYILATTGQRDQNIQKKARELTQSHQKKGLFRVHVYFWEDIEALFNKHRDVCKRWYPDLFPDDKVLEAVSRIENTQKKQVIQEDKNSNEAKVSITTLSQKIDSLSSSLAASGAGAPKVYQVALNQTKSLLDQFKPKTALAQLEALKEGAWDEADQITKWKILNNIASAKLQLNKDKEAAQLFIEAAQYNKDDEKAICNLAVAYMLLDNFSEADKYIDETLQKNSASERAFALRVRNKSLQNEKFDSILKQIPEEFRNLQQVASALGDAAKKEGDLSKSQYWHENAFKNKKDKSPEISIAYATSLLVSIVEDKSVLHTGMGTKQQNTQLDNIIEIYNDAYTKIADSEYIDLKVECVFNRGVAYRLKGDFDSAAKDFDLAISIEPDNDKYTFHRAELAFVSEHMDSAISLLEKIKESKTAPAALLLSEIYKTKKDFSKSIEVLKHYLKNDPPVEFSEHAHRLLIETLMSASKNDEADKESDALLFENSENVINLLVRARVLGTIGKEKEAKEHLAAARRLTNKNSPFIEILALADQYYSLRDYKNAAIFYEFVADVAVDSYMTRNLLNCYYQLGNEQEALKICTLLRQNYGALKKVSDIESYIYEEIGNLEKAKEICKEYVKLYPEDLGMQLRLAVINLREQNLDGLDNFLKQKHNLTKAGLKERIHLSQLLSLRRFDEEALKIMYETRRKFLNESDAHLNYIGVFMSRDKENDPFLEVDKVAVDTAVCIQDSEEVKKWYIIENRQDTDISKNEIDLTHPLSKQLLGKNTGDTVVLVEEPQKKEGKIIELKSKYVYALHESASIFETQFPEAKGFNVLNLKMQQNQNTTEELDFSSMFKMLDKQHEYFIKVLDLYKNGQLTIGALAKLLGRNPIEAWGLLMNKPDIGIKSATGDPRETADAKRLLAAKNPKFAADITGIMTLHGLEVADKVVASFGKIGVTQTTIDQLTTLINSRKGLTEKGFMTMGKEGKSYVREEISAEQIKNNTEYLQRILEWIKANCEVIPCEEALKINSEKRQRMYELFGFDALDSILIAKQEKRLLLSDDERLRNFARNSYNVDGIWVQPILEYLLVKKIIDNSQYQKLLIKLVNSNYYHTSISADTLEEAAKQSSWKSDKQFEKIAGVLSGDRSDDFSALKVTSDFIYKLYTQQFFFTDPSDLLITVLGLFFKSRMRRRVLLAQLINKIRIRFIWLPARQQEIEQLINQWLRQTII